MTAVRTLHIDIEGGWGGSSRSLFELLSRLDRTRVAPVVVHRERGPLEDWYRGIDIPTVHVAEIGSYVPRQGAGAKILAASLPRLARIGRAAKRIADVARHHDAQVLHLNYEGLFLLAGPLKRQLGVPIVVHHRAHPPQDPWGHWLVRTLSRHADHYFFISPQEERRVRELEGRSHVPGGVVWNIARRAPCEPVSATTPPYAVYLGNIDPAKGTDRLIDIAVSLDLLNAPPLRIAVYGKARNNPRYAERLAERIKDEQLDHRITLAGYTETPMRVLAGALALVRPSRANDPWGRDVIEATALGVPVIATGNFDGVVEPAVTGWLHPIFKAEAMARELVALATDAPMRRRMSEAARRRGQEQFGGTVQAAEVTSAFERLAAEFGAVKPVSVNSRT